ncbi:hypothetical protein N7495_009328 [Penicillium taxi]|uniref:uncharacterized protein n=1 Tax=Penicillium taxi TaxID=168475 RepID=UPI002544FB8D|nr:uncharacterized protein N7495_009328 [Penicillium taxi]KAJ5884818.1 hypothetical protein N7495_009328 [Penicillium taxi]
MSDPNQASTSAQSETTNPAHHEHYHGLPVGSFTDQKLRHASAHHLHMTNRRFFIGPIPEGWLHDHRKSWYKSRLRFKNYTSKKVSFSVDPVTRHYTQLDISQSQGNSEPTAQPLNENITLTFTRTNNDSELEDESGLSEQEIVEGSTGDLRTVFFSALGEEEEANGNENGLGIDIGAESAASIDSLPSDSDSTPRPSRAGEREQNDVYDNGAASSSFVTARENAFSPPDTDQISVSTIRANQTLSVPGAQPKSKAERSIRIADPRATSPLSSVASAGVSEADSTTQLLKGKQKEQKLKSKTSGISRMTLEHQEPQDEGDSQEDKSDHEGRITKKMARFNIDDKVMHRQQRLRNRIAKTQDTISANRPRRRKVQNGEIVKAEKMLVLVEETMQDTLPDNYTENDSLRMETRTADKWREFLVVCRKSSAEHVPFSLQMYRTRVIPDMQSKNNKTPPYHEIGLNHKTTGVNFYSTLDKTLVLWRPSKHGTKIYILRPKSSAHAAEWYTFIRQLLGWRRPNKLPINVPDLGVSLIFKNPFQKLEAELGISPNDAQHTTILSRSAAGNLAAESIIRTCIKMLEGQPEWAEVLKTWSKTEKMGLAWKRYDRLEWVFGVNEENMYGTIAMQSSHELELRPRHHYSTTVNTEDKKEEEPPPVEGFLIRLTSQKGVHQWRNKIFFKRLYFFTEDHHLLFCRPAKAYPPAPPKLSPTDETTIPSPREILNEAPISWDIDPYPVQDGDVAWLTSGNPEYVQRHDEEAYAQMKRNAHNMINSDGYIDLCKVREVRHIHRGSSPADANIQDGPAVDFNPEAADSRQEDGATKQFEDDRIFEMVLENDLIVRLQAYDVDTCNEWVNRLDALVKYWRARTADDTAEFQAVRQRNLKLLDIDEETESIMGQFADKWEVKKAEASPHLHNMCSLSGCRIIRMSGQLYRKPRRRGTFARCHVLLTDGKLLIFRSTLRKQNGVQIPHIHQDLETTIDLSDCYIYSGLVTESDLLYANQTFDSNNPGVHALPRIYLASDGFTSRDEDAAITFVIWQPLKKSYFRAQEQDAQGEAKRSLRHVSTLGKYGRTIVFKARSRVEKDRWVLSISSEIDRLQEENHEDIRIVSQ